MLFGELISGRLLLEVESISEASQNGLRSTGVDPEADVSHEKDGHVCIGQLAVISQRRRFLLLQILQGGAVGNSFVRQV